MPDSLLFVVSRFGPMGFSARTRVPSWKKTTVQQDRWALTEGL